MRSCEEPCWAVDVEGPARGEEATVGEGLTPVADPPRAPLPDMAVGRAARDSYSGRMLLVDSRVNPAARLKVEM